MDLAFGFEAELWQHTGESPWVFITLPVEDAEEIRELVPQPKGFGSVRVVVEMGDSTWQTSIFPDSNSGSYLLPVKRSVRDAEDVEPGDIVDISLRLAGE